MSKEGCPQNDMVGLGGNCLWQWCNQGMGGRAWNLIVVLEGGGGGGEGERGCG